MLKRRAARAKQHWIRLLGANAADLGGRDRTTNLGDSPSGDGALFVSVQAKSDGDGREPLQRVVLSHRQPKLRSGSEQTVRLVHSARDEIIDEYADVRRLPSQHQLLTTEHVQRGVRVGDEPLSRGFLVAGRAVDLSGEEKARYGFHLQSLVELRWRIVVVLDRISRAVHSNMVEPRNRSQNLELHRRGKRRRQAVHVQLRRVVSFGLEKKLMTLGGGKLYDLVFDRRAVPWSA